MANCEDLVMSSMPKRVKAVLLSNIITGPRCSAKYGRSFAGNFTLQITDMADSYGIKITDKLGNYYK